MDLNKEADSANARFYSAKWDFGAIRTFSGGRLSQNKWNLSLKIFPDTGEWLTFANK